MMGPVCSCDNEFDGSTEELEGLEVLKLSVNEPFLQWPRNKNSRNDEQVIHRPLADVDTEGDCDCPSD